MRSMIALSLILCALTITSCITPGMKEPVVMLCSTKDGEKFECRNSDKPDEVVAELNRFDIIGFIAASPKGYGKLKAHHEALHTALNQCLEDRR